MERTNEMSNNVFDRDGAAAREGVTEMRDGGRWTRPLALGAAVLAIAGGLGLASASGQEPGARMAFQDDAMPHRYQADWRPMERPMGHDGQRGWHQGRHHMAQGAGWGREDGERGGWGRHGGGGMHGMMRMMDEIDTTPEQQKQLFDIFDGVRGEMRDAMIDLRATRGEVLDILGAAEIDAAAIEKIRAERMAAMDAASKTMAEALVKAAQVLTPEQRAKLAELVEERGERGSRGGWGRW
jgi:protein CpxP